MNRKYFFVVNPHSANGCTGRLWPQIKSAFESKIGQVTFEFTKGNIHATYLAGKALYDGFDTIIAVGGDGTLNEVLNGFYDADRQINEKAVLGYYPSGTGQDFARSVGLAGRTIVDIVDTIVAGNETKIDIGLANFHKLDGTYISRRFINECSVGFSADVAGFTNRASKMLGGKLTFAIGVIARLITINRTRVRITVDFEKEISRTILLAVVANGQYMGGGMQMAPHAQINDGCFDLVVISEMTRIELMRNIGNIYSGKHVLHPKVEILKAKDILIETESKAAVEMDGESVGETKLRFKMLAKEMNFISPLKS